ncbi:MAG: RNase adapter RapZ [Gammaproteobacteria bacterium]|nr:RNase adapter RapZ [Gammaproteobacteria bacterium]
MEQRRLIILSGLSGAGKSIALNSLEDLGFYCIDNLPISLLDEVIKQLADSGSRLTGNLAIGIDARDPSYDFTRVITFINELNENNIPAELVFMEADDDILTKRFSETRRRHPLSSDTVPLIDAIREERRILEPLSENADVHIDTSHTLLHELRDLVRIQVAKKEKPGLSLQFLSFGFKHGVPRDADFVFDVRCLPNPHWKKELRPFTGLQEPVAEFLGQQALVLDMIDHIRNFLEHWIPKFEADNRSYLSIAIGCTGGHHRSVYIVKQLSDYFLGKDKKVIVRHRDI